MARAWKIKDLHECVSTSNSSWYRNWKNNTALAAETDTVIYFVEMVVFNMRGYDEGRIKMHAD